MKIVEILSCAQTFSRLKEIKTTFSKEVTIIGSGMQLQNYKDV